MSRHQTTFTPATGETRALRDAMGLFPTGVVIVTAAPDGVPIGMTMNSFSSVSLDPALVLFSVGLSARSIAGWRQAEGFAIHVLSEDQRPLSDRFARAGEDKFAGLTTTPGHGGAPMIEGARAVFECAPHACHEAGDHAIFVARITAVHVSHDRAPLVFSQGAYASLVA